MSLETLVSYKSNRLIDNERFPMRTRMVLPAYNFLFQALVHFTNVNYCEENT